jgi:CDP-glucose 4,6-dehydratase
MMTTGPHSTFRGRRILVTGHTGFKGGWLVAWLRRLGAEVAGLSLPPEGTPNLFEQAAIADRIEHRVGDIRDAALVARTFADLQPEIVFHLAAQAIVGEGFDDPVATVATNVLGTSIVLEAARNCPATCVVLVVTSDKCYRNQDVGWGYRETDPLGGHDPYSASKAAAEIVTEPYLGAMAKRRSGAAAGVPLHVATLRAGNVIGGGDWSKYRIVPDFIRAAIGNGRLHLRAPHAVRPWQHVLEALSGYLVVAERLWAGDRSAVGAWNFGPRMDNAVTVAELVEALQAAWPDRRVEIETTAASWPDASFLRLAIDKAWTALGWRPRLDLAATAAWTADWYRASAANADLRAVTDRQIAEYEALNAP